MIYGRDLILSINGAPIAAAKSCTLAMEQSFLTVSNPFGSRWNEYIPERATWKVSANCLLADMANVSFLMDALANGTPLSVSFYDNQLQMPREGVAYIKSLSLEAAVDSLARMSVSLTGSGELTSFSIPNVTYGINPKLDYPDKGAKTTFFEMTRQFGFVELVNILQVPVIMDKEHTRILSTNATSSTYSTIEPLASIGIALSYYDTCGDNTIDICLAPTNDIHYIQFEAFPTAENKIFYHNPKVKKTLQLDMSINMGQKTLTFNFYSKIQF